MGANAPFFIYLDLTKKAKKMSIRNSCQKNPHLFIIERGQNCGDVLL